MFLWQEQFDANSAFFARAASKAPSSQPAPTQPIPIEKPNEGKASKKEKVKPVGPQKNKEIKKSGNKLKERKEEEDIEEKKAEEQYITPKIPEDDDKTEKDNIEKNLDSVIFQSRQLAVKGNEFAAKEEYLDAINMFSGAIELDPTDNRYGALMNDAMFTVYWLLVY